MLILVPNGVASINVNGTTVHSTFGLPCPGKIFPLDSNSLAALRNKYSEFQLIILDELSMVSKKSFYQMHRRLTDCYNLPNLPFASRSILVVGDIVQLPPARGMPVYASIIDQDYPESYNADYLRGVFNFVELTEVMWQRGSKHFINLLNKVCVGNVDCEVERTLMLRIICIRDFHYPNNALLVSVENFLVFNHNKVMPDQLSGLPITINPTNSTPICYVFSDSQIMAARNYSIYQTGGLSKTLTLKLEANVMPTNINITDSLINGQIGVVKYLKFLGDKVDTIYVKFIDINAGK